MRGDIKKDDAVIFDFILHKMLKIDERVVYADRKIVYLEPQDENVNMYTVITIDASGRTRKYSKECKPLAKWLQIATM